MAQVKDIPDTEILECIRTRARGDISLTPDEALADKYPAKVILRKMEQMVERGLLEYGVSVRTAWIVGEPLPTSEERAKAFALQHMTADQIRELADKVKADGGRCVLQLPNAASLDITDIVLAAAEKLETASVNK